MMTIERFINCRRSDPGVKEIAAARGNLCRCAGAGLIR
jgi:hypothetical protein